MHAIAISAIRRCTPFAGTAIRSIGVIEKPEGHNRRIEHVVMKLIVYYKKNSIGIQQRRQQQHPGLTTKKRVVWN